jgi:hypothetical protein
MCRVFTSPSKLSLYLCGAICTDKLKSEEDDDPPEPTSATRSPGPYSSLFAQHSNLSRRQSRAQIDTVNTEDKSSAAALHTLRGGEDSNYDAEFFLDDATHVPSQEQTGYLGQMCEVQWLQNLKDRLHTRESAPQLEETDFYLDRRGFHLMKTENPFHLPDQDLAMLLFQCYYRTVHMTFPIVPSDFEGQLRIYYNSIRSGHTSTMFPQKWYAVVNLILAIGARFSHLTNAQWQTGALNETLYVSQAYQLLRPDDQNSSLIPDLSTIQVRTYSVAALEMLTTAGHWAACFLPNGYRSR